MHRISMICHMYGWGVPAILTLVALLTHSIEADELTSICLPGMFNVLYSVIYPCKKSDSRWTTWVELNLYGCQALL